MKILDELYYGNISGGDRTADNREELVDILRLIEKKPTPASCGTDRGTEGPF